MTSYNAPAALVIPTPDDIGSPIHPGIVHLEQPVGGYIYWMAFTPYPSGSDVLENPCIVASNDGITWVVPDGVTNPLDPIPGDPSMVQGNLYNSDTDIAFVDGKLYLFWRRNNGAYARIYVRTSTDGVAWTPRQVVHDGAPSGEYVVSPFFHHDGELWHMWYGHRQLVGLRHRTATNITGPWSEPDTCTFSGLEGSRWAWHFDAVRYDDHPMDGLGGVYVGLFNTMQHSSTNVRAALHLAASRDGLHWHVGACVLEPVKVAPGFPPAWDSGVLYRGTLLVEDDKIRVWYTSMGRHDSIGYTEIPLIELSSALDAIVHA